MERLVGRPVRYTPPVMLMLAAMFFQTPALSVEPVTLWPIYQQRVLSPCQYVGFSFAQNRQDRLDMKKAGAEMVAAGSMWIPVPDPQAPYGCGVAVLPHTRRKVVQRFTLAEPFRGVVVQLPTHFSVGSVTVAVYRFAGDERQPLGERRWEDVPDEFLARLEFDVQKPGVYALEVRDPSGTIALWLTRKRLLPGLELSVDDRRREGESLEFAHIRPDGSAVWHSHPEDHYVLDLARRRIVDEIAATGLKCTFSVGNWNNGGFPYYPDWFYEKFPDITMVDAQGQPITAGMFGAAKGWPSIDHPVIVDGTKRHVKAIVQRNREAPNLIYWSLGGEALYPTYLRHGDGWPDYGPNAIAHFRAWLQRKYSKVANLNVAWGANLRSFAAAQAPRRKSVSPQFLDWIDFHFAAMAERMAWHYAAVKAVDADRIIATSNHGNIFWSDNYAALGADLPQYADVADGFEMGQIMRGADPGCYNLWWASSLAGLGKIGAPSRLAYSFPNPTARGGGTSYTPEAARRYSMEAFGSGWWHLGFIQWSGSLPDGEWGVKGTPAEKEIARIFADLKRVRPLAESAWPVLPKIGLYLSHQRWVLKDWHPDWTTFHVWALQHQYDHAIAWEQQVLTGEIEQYPVLVSIHNDLVSPQALTALEGYVRRGGHLILIGDFAVADAAGRPAPAAAIRFLEGKRVHKLPADMGKVLAQLPNVLETAGVKPFCQLKPLNEVNWALEIDPLTGRHDRAPDLAPRHVFGQTFIAPGPRIHHVAFRTPTYTNRPSGFSVILRLRREGPDGRILAQGSVAAADTSDNAWTGIDVEVTVEPGAKLFLEITPDRDLPGQQMGVWASTHAEYGNGQAYVDSAPKAWDFEFKVGYQVRMPSRLVIEAFTLFDGANFLTPLVNLSDEEARVEVTLDPALLTADPREHTWVDALTGDRLGPGDKSARISVAAKGYRMLALRRKAESANVAPLLQAAAARLAEWAAQGMDTSYHQVCLHRARQALKEDRPAKSLGYLNRLRTQPLVRVDRCEPTAMDDIRVELHAQLPDGQPFTEALGVVRAVPVPNARARLREVSPGQYATTFPASALLAYDYADRKYKTYDGPLQVIANLWRRRTLAQVERRVR